ncbi:MAG TPA: ethanolamine ammonia-lyase subunit EutC [Bacteroidota bacterium]|nr:ethanolamine ammonia-lyase subunit EutC [Bacteroidota bacterium]
MTDIERESPWRHLRNFTPARIGLGRTGGSLLTSELLKFKLDHARAKDAIDYELDFKKLREAVGSYFSDALELKTKATDRSMYLQRPDLGRSLDEYSANVLKEYPSVHKDICIVAADGLSPLALELQFAPLMKTLVPRLHDEGLACTPLCLVKQGRVAIGDEIGYMLRATLVVVCIGERPGLSSPDSLGVYLTYQPKPGRTDESRNCVSNIRAGGLHLDIATHTIFHLVQKAFRLKISGVQLKDESDPRMLATE